MNSSHAITEPIQARRPVHQKGSLWANQDDSTYSKVSLPIAVGLATGMTLLLVGVCANLHLRQPDETTSKITRVELIPPVVAQAPPVIIKPTTKPTVSPVIKAVPQERIAQVAVPKVVSPEIKAPQPAVVPAAIPAVAQPMPAAPAIATPNATGTTTGPSTPTSTAPTAAKPANQSTAIGAVCPVQVKPEMPRRAIEYGLVGTVRARALIQDGMVKEVTILSGPQVFHAAVKAAMLQYKCDSRSEPVSAEQSIEFRAAE